MTPEERLRWRKAMKEVQERFRQEQEEREAQKAKQRTAADELVRRHFGGKSNG